MITAPTVVYHPHILLNFAGDSGINGTMTTRFFCDFPLAGRQLLDLPEAAAHHAVRVLRLKSGEDVTLFDGQGGEFTARIVDTGRVVRVELLEWRDIEREASFKVTLAQALPSADKMDWIVQKAVELGVARIVPLAATRSVVKLAGERATRRVQHWQSVAVAACEQCGRNRVPEIAPLFDLRQWLSQHLQAQNQVSEVSLLLAPEATRGLGTLIEAERTTMGVTLLIGPEGGWTEEEVAVALACGFQPVSLGTRVLRTETAGLAALAALAALHGDI